MFAIFDKLGGQDAAIEAVKARSHGKAHNRDAWPTKEAEKKWRSQGELPGQIVKTLMEICDERGIAYASSDFKAGAQ